MADADIVVIGAGAAGLAIARALAARGENVLVLEQHPRAGLETSSRNSEVIHAGLYYQTSSLKARLCVAGARQHYGFARDNGVACLKRGKLIVARTADELPVLQLIQQSAARNGAGRLVMLTSHEVRAREPELACHAALLSPETGVIDSAGYLTALEGYVLTHGGEIVFNAPVTRLEQTAASGFRIGIGVGAAAASLTSNRLVLAAGLGSTHLGAMLETKSAYSAPRTYFAKGHYVSLSGLPPFEHLVYPVPKSGSLGLHYTLDTGGCAKFGPDIEWCDEPNYNFDDDGGNRLQRFETAIRGYWPGLPKDALSPGYTGVRPKLTPAGEPAADFAIHTRNDHGIEGLIALYGIESPGLTASLAIGEYVADLLNQL